jgi:aryl-alcohol dehydrogenase-like predicted oxidoreductase
MNRTNVPGTDLSVSPISYGTADLGVDMSDAEAAVLLDAYRDAGGNFIDTAHVYAFWTRYGAGSSETTIARYVKEHGGSDLVIATKGGHPGLPGYRSVERWLDPGRVHADIQDSLGRLQVDRIDLYYLHRDDTRFTVAEIIDMLNAEISAGSLRAIAASNWTHERLSAANEYAASKGLAGFVASQVQWSFAVKDTPPPKPHGDQGIYAQPEDIGFHERTGLPLCAYTSTARGYFSEKEPKPKNFDSPESRARLERARSLAAEKGVGPNQIALAWMMHQDFPCIPITGTTNVEHLRENLAATEISLSAPEMDYLTNGGNE